MCSTEHHGLPRDSRATIAGCPAELGREMQGLEKHPRRLSTRRRITRQAEVGLDRRLTLGLAGLVILTLVGAVAWGQSGYEQDGYDQIERRGLEHIDRLNEALERWGRLFLKIGVALGVLVAIKIIGPIQIYHNLKDRQLRRQIRGVEDLIKRIESEAVTISADSEEADTETAEGAALAGMAEMADYEHAEHVPAYVLTVHDLTLDNMRTTLRKLRRSKAGDADRYRAYLFSVLRGLKVATEQSAEAGIGSGLAVNVREYFRDERRYRLWQRLLRRYARRGEHHEVADAFLVFMKTLRDGKRPAAAAPAHDAADDTAVFSAEEVAGPPDALSEDTLPLIQQAAIAEARNLCAVVETGRPIDKTCAWQFEFVRRQRGGRGREEAQSMLGVFLSCQREALQDIAKIKMLPVRTWEHVLYMLGVEDAAELERRVANRLLTIQEIIILEKAFLQTFAKRSVLERVYGHSDNAGLLIDMHVPQIRRESLAVLRESRRTESKRLDRATEELNEEETPMHNEVRRLMEHYLVQGAEHPG
jgi:hypothetical protein